MKTYETGDLKFRLSQDIERAIFLGHIGRGVKLAAAAHDIFAVARFVQREEMIVLQFFGTCIADDSMRSAAFKEYLMQTFEDIHQVQEQDHRSMRRVMQMRPRARG